MSELEEIFNEALREHAQTVASLKSQGLWYEY